MTQAREQSVPIVLDGADAASDSAVIRASVSLSSVTRRPVEFHWDSGELSSADLAVFTAAESILGNKVEGAHPGARSVSSVPGGARPGIVRLELGDADLSPLFETVSVPLALSGSTAELHLSGITHATQGPSFHDLAFGWMPLIERAGITGELRLDSAGFRPEGGGRFSARVFPSPRMHSVDLTQRGLLVEVQAIVLLANLRMGIAVPLEARVNDRLRAFGIAAQAEVLPLPSERGRGLAVVLIAQFEKTRVAFVSVGGGGRSAEAVSDEAVNQLHEFLQRRGAVPGPIAERVLVPVAIASSSCGAPGAIGREVRGTSRITTTCVTGTLLALAQVARRFLDVEIQVQGLPGDEGLVEIRPA